MYTVVRSYPGNTDLADALVENQDEVRRIISGIEGFYAYHLVRDTGGTFTISVFEDQAGAEESSRAAAEWLRENLADMQISPPEILAGEALLSF